MATVGVEHKVVDRATALQMPSYAYRYPHLKRVRLAAVKEGIFHPNPPSFYRMENDNYRDLLPDQHSRTSTPYGPSDFARAQDCLFPPPTIQFPSLNLSESGRTHHRLYSTPEEIKKAREEWSQFLTQCPERFDVQLPEMPDYRDLHFTGYACRSLRPNLTRSWRYTLQSEPKLDKYAQKPTPANTYVRYRDAFPRYSRNAAAEPWH